MSTWTQRDAMKQSQFHLAGVQTVTVFFLVNPLRPSNKQC